MSVKYEFIAGEGKTRSEIIRCLKRHLARELWAAMRPLCTAATSPTPLDRYRSLNALAETINGLYKTEVIRAGGPWHTVEEVELATAEWVDWFNHPRLRAYNGDHLATDPDLSDQDRRRSGTPSAVTAP